MIVIMSWYSSFSKNIQFLKNNFTSINLKPSDTIYFDEYLYKVSVPGGKIHDDIFLHTAIDESLRFKLTRSTYTKSARYIYFRFFNELEEFVDEFMFNINYISGPIDQQHWDFLINKSNDKDIRYELREKNYFSLYDSRIEFCFFGNDKYNEKAEKLTGITKIVESNSEEHRWSNLPSGKMNFYHCFLFYNSDNTYLMPLLKLNYSSCLREVKRVKLMSDFLE